MKRISMTALQTPALMVDRVTMKLEATSVFVNQDGPDNDVREILETVSTNLVKTMLIVLTYSKTSSACMYNSEIIFNHYSFQNIAID